MRTEKTMTVMVMKMAFMLPFTYGISSSYSMNDTQTSSREAQVNVSNSLIKINFRVITRNHSALHWGKVVLFMKYL